MSKPDTVAEKLINVFTGAVLAVLGIRFVFKLLGANPVNDFVDWIYETSAVLLQPFRGIFPVEVIDRTYVLEFSTLFAMMIYAVVGYLLIALVDAVATGVKDRK